MLRCPACGNEADFIVREVVLQDMPITCHGPESYTCGDPTCIDVEEWVYIECDTCGGQFSDAEGRDTYAFAHTEADTPIPYTLVDASTT